MAASIVPVLAKLAIPMGVGLLFLAAKKGSSETAEADNALELAVDAMQNANATELQVAIDRLKPLDPITADLLSFQKSRMIARGTRGFTDAPLFTDDGRVLMVNNQEIAVRLIQLEGRAKALEAWAKAYARIGAKALAADLRTKAAALRGQSSPKDDKAAKDQAAKDKAKADKAAKEKAKKDKETKAKGDGAATPDLSDVVKQVTDALASGSVDVMRKVAADLRAHGFTTQADSLEAAANELQAELDAKKGTPPAPTPPPPTHRTVEVTSKLNSESAITKKLLGKPDRWKELVSVNIPKDADGRSRQKVTTELVVAKSINPNRLGGLYPGLQPGQRLFVPDDWKLNPEDTAPAKPKPVPAPVVPKPSNQGNPPDTGDNLTTQLITMLVGKTPGKEDTFLVKKWQTAQKRVSDGKYGPGDALYIAKTLGVVPPSPLYWPKKDTQKALSAWHQEMAKLALERPDDAEAYRFADHAGKQPGFEGVPSSAKIVSRRFGDGLGSI